MEQKSEMTAKDISLSRLVATNSRKFTNRDLAPIRMSMEEIGMLEPLTVYEEGETALIIEGNKRYFILLGAGIESAPCILAKCPDTYTPSYQVIAVSPVERAKMIKKVLETVDENKVAAAIGVSSLKPVLTDKFADGLNPAIILAFERGLLTKTALQELKSVTPKRQAEILKVLTQSKNYNLDVIRGQILETPQTERVAVKKRRTPWQKNEEKMNAMTKRLEEVEKQRDLMSHMYHTYVSDVTKQLAYVRGFLKDKNIEQYVTTKYPEVLKAFRTIMERE
jgi:ParB-like chromosome segregation protein Spo0J